MNEWKKKESKMHKEGEEKERKKERKKETKLDEAFSHLGKVWIQLFFPQLWVNDRENELPWLGN